MRRRVVITGIGAVTPIGIGVEAYWNGLISGASGVGPVTLFDASGYPCRIAAEVSNFDGTRFFERRRIRMMARSTQFGVAAALLCLDDAAWDAHPGDGRLGVVAGVSNSAQDAEEEAIRLLQSRGYRRTLPYSLSKSMPHAVASETGLETGFQDQVKTFSTACAAGFNAIELAAAEIRDGRGDAFLCTSTDASIADYAFAYFCRAGMLSSQNDTPSRASRPFDAKRDGGVLGEGAACLLLEDAEHARRRGAVAYGEILGVGTSGVGYGGDPAIAIPHGMAQAMSTALAAANCGPDHIEYVGCHGVSDVDLDVWETVALKRVFGEAAQRIPMSSVKAQIGIPQNAAGTLQLVATLLALRHDILPATMNYEYPDPRCDLDYIPNKPRRNRISRALVFAHGFNGSDAAIVLGRPSRP